MRRAGPPDAIQSIREARDAVLAKNRELTDKLAKSEDQIAELGDERDDAISARDAALAAARELARENEALRAQVAKEGSPVSEQAEESLAKAEARIAELSNERDDAISARDEALNAAQEVARDNEALRTQIEAAGAPDSGQAPHEFEEIITIISEERDGIRQLLALRTEENKDLAARLAAAGMVSQESAQLAAELAEAQRKLDEKNEAAERLAQKRKKSIAGLVEQLAIAQGALSTEQQKREALEKQLHEQGRDFEAIIAMLKAEVAGRTPQPAVPISPAAEPAPAPTTENGDQLSDDHIHDALTSMFFALTAVKEHPQEKETIVKLHARLRDFAAQTAGGTRRAMHVIATACADFVAYLERSPTKVAQAVPLLEKAVETLGWLLLRSDAASLDITGAMVCAVDDDMDNCECISAAFEKVSLQTKYTGTPETALEQIAGNPCKLIILDVDLPRMDGFEVHARIRKIPGHEKTPVIFLTGHLSTAHRVGALQPDNSQFLPKPYTLSELSLHTLILIVEASLPPDTARADADEQGD